MSTQTIQADFDRIALLSTGHWDHAGPYANFLLRHAPLKCHESLEIGCGTGVFSRLIAGRSQKVLAIDLSPQMIRLARERSRQFANIDFRVADVTTLDLPPRNFDCIVSIATLHHLPFAETLTRMKAALKSGGVLLVLDLFAPEGLLDAIRNIVALPVSGGMRLIRTGRLKPPRALRDAWTEHGRHDTYLTMKQVREVCAELLPGAKIQQHLLWRYSIVWQKTNE
ncbi:MAG: Methyltransferase type 11 [Acidobacteria bacterium]|nr:Methyltransferase type 11 [Acidobacteriota bacterium]